MLRRARIICLLVLAAVCAFAVPTVAQYDEHAGHSAGLPAGTGVLNKLVEQILVAVTHTQFSLNQTALAPRHTHAHHVVNILEGAEGPHFDASKGNPGDGYGAINYARIAPRTPEAEVWAENTLRYLTWAAEAAVAATRTNDFAAAGEAMQRALAFLSAALGREDDTGALGAALALRAAMEQRPAEGNVVTIDIRNFAFGDGQDLTIPVGTTVVWTNHDSVPHNVVGGPLASPVLNPGDTYSYTFTEPMTFTYVCAFHPTMTQRIIVVP